jgi:hypothetical protein
MRFRLDSTRRQGEQAAILSNEFEGSIDPRQFLDAPRRENLMMDPVLRLLPEDEIYFCGLVLMSGIILGAAARLTVALLRTRSA